MGQPEDAALVAQVLSGDRAAFGPLVDRYGTRVHRLCYALLRHREDAEDAAQETFLRAYRALERFDPQGSFMNWALKIATNVCRDRLRRRRHEGRAVPVAGAAEPVAADPPDPPTDPAALLARVDAAVAGLPHDYREVFHLHHREGLSVAAMAEVLDRPIGTIKTQLHRARRLLCDLVRKKVSGTFSETVPDTFFCEEKNRESHL